MLNESKHDPDKIFPQTYNYAVWFKNEKLPDKEESTDLPPMPPKRWWSNRRKRIKNLNTKQTIN